MIEYEITLKNEDEINALLECEAVDIGGTKFIREDIVKSMVASFATKKLNEGIKKASVAKPG
jgi:hypothetical protein